MALLSLWTGWDKRRIVGETFAAVTAVRQAPINVQNVVTYDVVIGVSNDDLKLFPGMTANVKILVDHRDNALKIPNAALRYRPAASAAGPTNRKTRGAASFGSCNNASVRERGTSEPSFK